MLTKKPIIYEVRVPSHKGRNIYISICEPESIIIFYVNELTNRGYKVYHNWDMDINNRDDMTPETLRNISIQNMADIEKSDIFIIIANNNSYTYPEAFAELGIALMSKKPAIIVDSKKNPHIISNPYYHTPCVFKAKDLYELYNILDTLYENF